MSLVSFLLCSSISINLFCREMYFMLCWKQEKIDRSPNFDPRKWPLIALAKSGPKQKRLLMLAMLHAKISRKWCASRKCSVKRNKSMSLTKRRRSSFDNNTFFGPNGSRCTRLKRSSGWNCFVLFDSVLVCLTEFPKQQYKLDYNLEFLF